MSLQTVNESAFQSSVRKKGVTLVEFGAPWCPPCKALLPILDELSDGYGEKLAVLTVNCDESPTIAAEYDVMSMPTVIVFNDGQPVDKLVGLRPKTNYETLLTRYIQK